MTESRNRLNPFPVRSRGFWPIFLLGLLVIASVSSLHAAAATERRRIGINEDWRFIKGDPEGSPGSLMYDIRPEVRDRTDDRPADSQPTEAERLTRTNLSVLKPWILPSANAFIADPAGRHSKPAAEPPFTVPCTLPGFDDSAWRQVNLPHDWAIEGPFDRTGRIAGGGMGRLPSPGVGWYRKKLMIPAADADKCFFLQVDGAMAYAMVWINGKLVGGWPYGYASWQVDLTPHIKPGGENQLAIRLDNPPDSSRWYPGGGIYRNVWLIKTAPIHVGQWGTWVTTPRVSNTLADVQVQVAINNQTDIPAQIEVTTELFAINKNGRRASRPTGRIHSPTVTIPARGSTVTRGMATVKDPQLWGPPPTQSPNLHVAVTTLRADGKPIDVYETTFGIRDIQFDPTRGIIVNGEHIRIRGVNQHHDLGALGAAFNHRAAQRQLELLREMGCNAVRMAHNPPAPEILELTDAMGFLVVNEIFDAWERKKTPLDFHLIFPEWHEADLRALIRRDRNHPSIFLWSVGNEVGEQYTGDEGAAVAERLCTIAHQEDPTRPATAAMNWAKPDMPLPETLDVISLNYQGEGIRDTPAHDGMTGIRTPPQYPAFRDKFPGKVIISSETAAALSSRGEYMFPVFEGISGPVKDGLGGSSRNRHVSAYELHAADFGSSADKVFAAQDRHPFVAGEFVWSGWDYLGEPTPYYSSRSSYFGIIDLAGFKKDRFHLYQSRWRPDLRMAHILPHWTWPEREGQITPVHVFTSGDEAELFMNGKSLGRKRKGEFEYRLRWDTVTYQPGTLRVVAYKNKKRWATAEQKTAGAATQLKVEPDRRKLDANGTDLSFVTVSVRDRSGILVPRADLRIDFSVEGPGEIVATDNGDPTSLEPFQSWNRRAFNGLCLAIIRGRAGQPGKIKLTARADGLSAETVTIQTVSPQAARR